MLVKIFFIINPKSGRKDGVNLEAVISERSRQLGFQFLIHRLHTEDDSEDILQDIKTYEPNIVAGAGGDGTINFLAGLLAGTNFPLLIMPVGSANGMAKELNIPNLDASFGLINTGVSKKIDLLDINGKQCLHLADVGLNARVVKRFEHDNSHRR
ncbi:MAG: hypothetical protein EOO07_26165 [Chitinophagaceae bacterium]|nr:MAG: hypothetical protein EOO07_26165 [Chitinophagaceae bacterium]